MYQPHNSQFVGTGICRLILVNLKVIKRVVAE